MATVTTAHVMCDIDLQKGKQVEGKTFQVKIDGRPTKYIDLCEQHEHKYIEPLAGLLDDQGRRKEAAPKMRRRAKPDPRAYNTAVREWAQQQGLQVSDRGRIPQAIVEQYQAAH